MEGFSHVIGSTRFHGTYGILNLCIASHYDKRQVGIRLSDMLEQYQSVVVGQAQVGKNQMECIYRENLEEANEEIRRIMNQRERLLLTITHDIKAPAASISGFIDLMKDYVDNPQGISCLNSIKGSATHLSRLVAALLDYHQLENGLMKLNPVDFSPADMFRQCAGEMQILSREKGLELHLELDGISSPQTYYRADAFRIRQILNNLVSNAIKYTDKGSVTIQAAISPQHLLTFSVRDTGKGMTTEERQKVFQAFTRLKSAQGIEGNGLGLNITQELVNLLQGTLRLESVKDKGSTFTVTIPLALGTAPAAEEAEEQKPLAPVKPHFENHKILLLDDDPLQLRLLQEMLKKLVGDSWQVFACLHVAEALTMLHNEHPALMMMDIEMPEMNGIRMIQHINHSHMKVVAMTAHDASIIRELKEAGFDDCLFKPFSTEKLKEILGLEDAASETEDIAEKTSSEAEDMAEGTNKNSRFAPLLTFAEGDPEAEAEILSTVKQELSSHLQNLQHIRKSDAHLPFIVMTSYAEVQNAVCAMKSGATDYVAKPFLRNLRSSEAGNGIEHVIAIERFRQKITYLILQLYDVLTTLGVANHLLIHHIIQAADFRILFADKLLLLFNLQSLLLQQILLLLERSTEDFFCMSDCLLIALSLLYRDITARLADLRQHISRNPVLELHSSRKLRAEN
jgi:signal transduction histidine kinase/CheY-like chemotaxis protein